MKSINLKIYGQVQGVFLRVAARKKALELGLFGWVKNVGNKVEILAEGEEEQLKNLKEWCVLGSEMAKVERVEEEWKDIEKMSFEDFKIVY